jgi:hypothetical protein
MLRKFLILFLILAGSGLLAQETAKVINEDFSKGIVIELPANLLPSSANFLAVSDSNTHELALSNLALDNQNVWIKKSTDKVTIENTAHWNYDVGSRFLFVDLRGIKGSLTAGSSLQLTILPLKNFETHLLLSVFEAPANSDAVQKVSDLDVDLK